MLYSLELKYSYCFSNKWEIDLALKVQMYRFRPLGERVSSHCPPYLLGGRSIAPEYLGIYSSSIHSTNILQYLLGNWHFSQPWGEGRVEIRQIFLPSWSLHSNWGKHRRERENKQSSKRNMYTWNTVCQMESAVGRKVAEDGKLACLVEEEARIKWWR